MSTILSIFYSRFEYCPLAIKKHNKKKTKTTAFDFHGLKNRNLSIQNKNYRLLIKYYWYVWSSIVHTKLRGQAPKLIPKTFTISFNALNYISIFQLLEYFLKVTLNENSQAIMQLLLLQVIIFPTGKKLYKNQLWFSRNTEKKHVWYHLLDL